MKYAEVAVNAPIARRRTFCYSIPPQLAITVGQAVWVPFGSRVLQGIVMKLTEVPSVATTKEIISLISIKSFLSSIQIELAFWLSDYYLAPIFDVVALMLPPGFERQFITYLQLSPNFIDTKQFTPEQKEMVNFVQKKDKVTLKEVEKNFGKKKANRITGQLVKDNALVRTEELGAVRVKPKFVPFVELTISSDQIENAINGLRGRRARVQVAIVEFLAKQSQPISLKELRDNVPYLLK
jgi:primosomal protein N' (replication factor Y)